MVVLPLLTLKAAGLDDFDCAAKILALGALSKNHSCAMSACLTSYLFFLTARRSANRHCNLYCCSAVVPSPAAFYLRAYREAQHAEAVPMLAVGDMRVQRLR